MPDEKSTEDHGENSSVDRIHNFSTSNNVILWDPVIHHLLMQSRQGALILQEKTYNVHLDLSSPGISKFVGIGKKSRAIFEAANCDLLLLPPPLKRGRQIEVKYR